MLAREGRVWDEAIATVTRPVCSKSKNKNKIFTQIY
jgi:hypothetical protein